MAAVWLITTGLVLLALLGGVCVFLRAACAAGGGVALRDERKKESDPIKSGARRKKKGNGMKTAKLVLGIILILLSLLVMLQSCAATVGDALENEGGVSGATGTIVAFLMLAGGIVSIAARSSKGGAIAGAVIFGLAGLLGLTSSGIFADLKIWGGLCLIMCAIFILSIFTQFKEQ